jgi:translation initiation factor 2B subunit (eIF-2B alpha/beta/delta family)
MVKLNLLKKLKKSSAGIKPSQPPPINKKQRKGFTKPSIPQQILVLESSVSGLSGALIGCSLSSKMTIRASAHSQAIEPKDAVAEIVNSIKEQGIKKLPKKAILITPSAAGNLLYLPVDPKKKMAKGQMSEMVRWELEELFVEQNDIWSIGALLQGWGYLNQQQRQECEENEEAAGGRIGSNSYNEYIESEQLGDCLNLQEQFLSQDEELAPGWSCHADPEEMDSFTWFGMAIGDGIRSRWVEACKKNGLTLSWIYPRLGCGTALIDDTNEWVMLDISQEQYAFFSGNGNRLKSLTRKASSHGLAEDETLVDSLRSILHSDIKTIYLSCDSDRGAVLQETLRQSFNQKVVLLGADESGEAIDRPHSPSVSMLGAAHHSLGFVKLHLLAKVEASPPGPPIYKNKQLYPWAALVVLLIAIGSVETYLNKEADANEWALELAEIDYQKRLSIKKQAQATIAEVRALEETLDAKTIELKEQQRLAVVLDTIIRKRQDLVPGIIEALGKSVNNLVVLKTLEENEDRSGFSLEGWALKDTEGQIFTQTLSQELKRWNYKLSNISLNRGRNKQGLHGFILRLNMVKTPSAKGHPNA